LCFASESREPLAVVGHHLWEYFECDGAVEPRIAGLVDLTHAAGADVPDYRVGAEAFAD
jgi:hypothetical protein